MTATAAKGNMPFDGHRTVAQWDRPFFVVKAQRPSPDKISNRRAA